MRQFNGIWLITKQNIKLLLVSKAALIVIAVFGVLVAYFTYDMMESLRDRSALPIGVIDYDQSELSGNILTRLKQMDSLYVLTDSEEEAVKALKEERIMAYFVIKDGYEEKIKKNSVNDLIQMHYLKGKSYITVLSDIFARSMIFDVVNYKGLNYYLSTVGHSQEELDAYLSYSAEYELYEKDVFQFEKQYYNFNKDQIEESSRIDNTLLSQQVGIGIIAMLFAFFALFILYGVRLAGSTQKRLAVSMVPKWCVYTGEVLTVMLLMTFFAVLYGLYMILGLKITTMEFFINIIYYILLYCLQYVFLLGALSHLCKKEMVFQVLSSLIIIMTGAVGVLSMIGAFTWKQLTILGQVLPNYWFIDGVTDSILGNPLELAFQQILLLILLMICYYGSCMKSKLFR